MNRSKDTKKVIMVISFPHGGKSTFINKYLTHPDVPVITKKEYAIQARDYVQAWHKNILAKNLILQELTLNKCVIFECDLLSPILRHYYIKEIKKQYKHIKIEAAVIIPSCKTFQHNINRDGIIMSKEKCQEQYQKYIQKLKIPLKNEGFQKIEVIRY